MRDEVAHRARLRAQLLHIEDLLVTVRDGQAPAIVAANLQIVVRATLQLMAVLTEELCDAPAAVTHDDRHPI